MLKLIQRSSAVALVSAFWGFLLTCVTFSFIVWSPHPGDDGSNEEYLSMALFCEVCILTLGCIQTTFSFIVFLASPKYKRSWTTVWICSHVVILLGLLLFYTIHTYTIGTYAPSLPTTMMSSKTGDDRGTGTGSRNRHNLVWILDDHENNSTMALEADLDIGNILKGSDSSGTGSVQSGMSNFDYYKFARFTSLDATILFDFLFLTIIFVCTLCESESSDSNSSRMSDNGYGNLRQVTVIAPAAPRAGGANRIQKFKSNNTNINQTKNNLNNNNNYTMDSITGLSLENERRGNSQFWNFPRRQVPAAPSVNSISGSVHNFPANNDRGTGTAVVANTTNNNNSINGYDFKPFQENLI